MSPTRTQRHILRLLGPLAKRSGALKRQVARRMWRTAAEDWLDTLAELRRLGAIETRPTPECGPELWVTRTAYGEWVSCRTEPHASREQFRANNYQRD